jgi:hypothetical protein
MPVEHKTVYELYVQLYMEPYAPGMEFKDSKPYQNMTDQMLHLVSLKKPRLTALSVIFRMGYKVMEVI